MSEQIKAVEVGRTWSIYDACAAVEGFDGQEHTTESLLEAWQYLIDTGSVWKLQGWYGRTVVRLIEAGHCHAAS